MSSHPWFIGREGPDITPLPSYVSFPRTLPTDEKPSEAEIEAYECLEKWGISKIVN